MSFFRQKTPHLRAERHDAGGQRRKGQRRSGAHRVAHQHHALVLLAVGGDAAAVVVVFRLVADTVPAAVRVHHKEGVEGGIALAGRGRNLRQAEIQRLSFKWT